MDEDGDQLVEELEEYPQDHPRQKGGVMVKPESIQHEMTLPWPERLNMVELRKGVLVGRVTADPTGDILFPLIDPTLVRKGRMPILCQIFGSPEGIRYRQVSYPSLSFVAITNQPVVSQVRLSPYSLNKSFVYILDSGATIYQWNGTKSNRLERAKALDMCTQIKFSDGRGIPDTVVIGTPPPISGAHLQRVRSYLSAEDGKTRSDEADAQFWGLLRATAPSADLRRDDDPLMKGGDESDTGNATKAMMVKQFDSLILFFEYRFTRPQQCARTLIFAGVPAHININLRVYFAKDPNQCVRLVLSGNRPSRQLLHTRFCYVLDCFSEIFVWVGALSKGSTRQLALKVKIVSSFPWLHASFPLSLTLCIRLA